MLKKEFDLVGHSSAEVGIPIPKNMVTQFADQKPNTTLFYTLTLSTFFLQTLHIPLPGPPTQ
jgi:hypothetical protein